MPLTRFPSKAIATILASAAISNVISFADYSGGSVIVPTAAWTAANMGFTVCDTPDGTFVPLRDQAGSLVQIANVVADTAAAYPLPDELFGCLYFKIHSCTTADVDTNQAATRSLTVILKG